MTDTTDTLVLGIGNLLLQDEGVGVHVVEQFQQHYSVPENVRVVDGGTKGLELLAYLEDAQRMLIVDAIDSGQPPGSILRLTDDEIPSTNSRRTMSDWPTCWQRPDCGIACRVRLS
jgi:hydrogenase maturation protease